MRREIHSTLELYSGYMENNHYCGMQRSPQEAKETPHKGTLWGTMPEVPPGSPRSVLVNSTPGPLPIVGPIELLSCLLHLALFQSVVPVAAILKIWMGVWGWSTAGAPLSFPTVFNRFPTTDTNGFPTGTAFLELNPAWASYRVFLGRDVANTIMSVTHNHSCNVYNTSLVGSLLSFLLHKGETWDYLLFHHTWYSSDLEYHHPTLHYHH